MSDIENRQMGLCTGVKNLYFHFQLFNFDFFFLFFLVFFSKLSMGLQERDFQVFALAVKFSSLVKSHFSYY